MSDSLDRAIALLTDGDVVDWEGLLEDAADTRERLLLEELRGVAQLDSEQPAPFAPTAEGSVGVPSPRTTTTRRRWGHLDLLEEIGRGTYGTVYRAWDTRLAREVALKLLVENEGGRSLEEARRLARVSHPTVVTVHGVDCIDGQVGLWMDLLTGRTLDDILAAQGPFSAREAIGIGVEICGAVAAIHTAGLVHRDIKAQNIMREPGGRLVLMDMGASLDLSHDDASIRSFAGTPLYMAPELFEGAAASTASDVYAIGVLLYRLVTGAFPVEAQTIGDIRRAYVEDALRPLRDARPEISADFVRIVDRCLAPDRSKRFASVASLERALQNIDVGAPAATHPRQVVWLLAAAMALGGTLGAYAWRTSGQTSARHLNQDQLKVAHGFEELAGSMGSRGEWRQAAAQYAEAEQIYRLGTDPDSPLVALARMKSAFAWQQAGDLLMARANYELAISKFESNFRIHPLLETAMAGLAALDQSEGRYDEAARFLGQALKMRARLLFDPTEAHADICDRVARRMADLGSTYRLDRDEDGDWIPDLLEAAIGLNPRSLDSDGNGRPDGDEAFEGISNVLRFGLVTDPTKIIVHYGGTDPEQLGFQQPSNRPFVAGPSTLSDGQPAWNVPSTGQSMYYLPLTSAQRSMAMTRGWRIVSRGEVHSGVALTSIDLTPEGPRFDINLVMHPHTLDLQLNTSVVPYEGIHHDLGNVTMWPLTQLEYDPGVKAAKLTMNGVDAHTAPYRGHRQFQENLGLFFGSFNEIVNVPKSDADFNLVMFVIR